jgi:hypothetical protein
MRPVARVARLMTTLRRYSLANGRLLRPPSGEIGGKLRQPFIRVTKLSLSSHETTSFYRTNRSSKARISNAG